MSVKEIKYTEEFLKEVYNVIISDPELEQEYNDIVKRVVSGSKPEGFTRPVSKTSPIVVKRKAVGNRKADNRSRRFIINGKQTSIQSSISNKAYEFIKSKNGCTVNEILTELSVHPTKTTSLRAGISTLKKKGLYVTKNGNGNGREKLYFVSKDAQEIYNGF